MATFATPGTPISRGLIFHGASTDRWMGEPDEDDSLIRAIRPSAAVGWIMIGGLPTLGSAWAWVIRSWTCCRAAYRSVPGWKVRSITDRPGIDDEWMRSSQGTPLSRACSRPH